MKPCFSVLSAAVLALGGASTGSVDQDDQQAKAQAKAAAEQLASMTDEQRRLLNTTPVSADRYPAPPAPHYGPKRGSINFTDTDPGTTIGGTLTMKPAVDDNGKRLNEAEAGITMYMIHWGLEVGKPGGADDAGAGDLGGDCMGFRDTGHVVMAPAGEAGAMMSWEIPQGTVVPEGAVYFVGHTLYGKIHNLGKCTQTPITNLVQQVRKQ